MANFTVPYNQAVRFSKQAIERGLIKAEDSLESQAAKLAEITSDKNNSYDFSQLHSANPLVKARSWINQNTTGKYDEYVDPLIKQALGDNSVSRVLSGIGRGIVDFAPELATIVATRRPNAGSLSKYAGNIAAATGAGLNAYGETGDTTTAATNAVLTGATPALVSGASSLATRIAPQLSTRPVASSLVSGAMANVPQSLVSAAYSPEMQQLSESGPVVASEKVDPLDFKRAISRAANVYSNPENVAIALGGGALGDAAVGLALNRQASAARANDFARNKLKSIGEIRKSDRDLLLEAGIQVPENASATDVDTALSRLTTEGIASQESVLKSLWSNVDDSKLNSKELAFKERLLSDSLNDDDTQFMLQGKHDVTNNLAEKSVLDMEEVFNDIDTTTFNPDKANPVSKFVDAVSRGFFNADEVTARNPVAKASINTLKNLEANSAQAQNTQLIRMGQNRTGSLSNIEALANLETQLKAVNDSPELQQKFQKFLDDGNKNISPVQKLNEDGTPMVDESGKPIMRRPTIYEPTPELSIETIMNKYGLTEEQAVFGKAIQNQTAHNAKLRYEAGEYKLATKIADSIANKLGIDRGKALRGANELVKFARQRVGSNSIDRNGDIISEAKPEIVSELSDSLQRIFGMDGGLDSTAYSKALAETLYRGEIVLLRDYAFNGRIGYTPMVRRGDFYLSYEQDGVPMFKGFKSKDEANKYLTSLKKNGIEATLIDGKASDMPVYNAIGIAQAANLKRNIAQAKRDLAAALTPEQLSKLDQETQDLILNVFDEIEKNFTAANNAVAKASLYEKGTMFQRKQVRGATALDMLQNTIDMATQNARSSVYARDYATLDYLSKDPTLVNDAKMAKYVNEKIDYMNNAETSEWRPVRSGAVLYYLAGSTSFLFQNLFQVPTLGLARWRNFTGRSSADFVKSLTKASKLIHDYDHLGTKSNKQDPILLACMKELENRKVFEQAYSQETMGRKRVQRTMSEIDSAKNLSDKLSGFTDDAIDWATQLVTASEGINRKWITASYLISENNYKPLAKRSKTEIEAVLRKASELSDAVNFTGGKATRPYFVQMLGKTPLHGAALSVMALQNYGLNLAAILTRQLRQLVPGFDSSKTIASKSYKQLKDQKGLLKTMAIMGAITGLYGLPGREAIDEAATKIFGEEYRVSRNAVKSINDLLEYIGLDEDGENGEQKKEIRNKLVDIIQFGLPAAGNLYLSNLVSNPLTPAALFKDPNISSLTGATGQMFSKVFKFAQAVKDGNNRVAARQLPSSANAIRKTVELIDTGVLSNSRGRPYGEPRERGVVETVGTLLGGMPVDVARGMYQGMETQSLMAEANNAKAATYDLAADLVDKPNALRQVYEDAVERGVILPDETAFVEAVANRVAERDAKYVKQAPLEIRKKVDQILKAYRVEPKYLSPLNKTKTALELAAVMQSPRAVGDLLNRFMRIDLGKSLAMESGIDSRLYSALSSGDLDDLDRWLLSD